MSSKDKTRLGYVILVISLLIGGLLRFYKLNWGENYFFHPDEYHIVTAVGRLINNGFYSNPKLFSYGSLTVYLIYITRQILVSLGSINPNIFIVGRFLAALFSTLTLINIFLLAKLIFPEKYFIPAITTFAAAFVPGLIQQAHFLTPESFMTFWITLSTLFFVKYFQKQKLQNLFLSAVFMGLAGGTKISSLAAIPFFLLILSIVNVKKQGVGKNIQKCIAFLFVTFAFFFISFPYSILDFENFRSITFYESSLSTGSINVFYTRSFENSSPFFFQLSKIYPYTMGPQLLISSFLGMLLAVVKIYKEKNKEILTHIILLGIFLSYFVFNSLLYTKWTRFVHPTIPFLIIFAFVGIYEITKYLKSPLVKKCTEMVLLLLIVVPTVTWGLMFFQIYKKSDVRIEASEWIKKNVNTNKLIITETGNTLEVPLSGSYNTIPFDFYNLDENPILFQNLINYLSEGDYFIIQSRRIYFNHKDKNKFPIVNNFYSALFSGKLGFEKVNAFSSFPYLKIGAWKMKINDESAEETWSVFDHPVIMVYKKTVPYPVSYYEKLLRQ
jgi:hypothetical protein